MVQRVSSKMEEYVRKCFLDYMSGALVHHQKKEEKKEKEKRMNVKAMSPNTKQEYLRKKNREYKAKSRERLKEKKDLSSLPTTMMRGEDDEGINFDGVLGECREVLAMSSDEVGGPGKIDASSTFVTIQNFLETMCKRNPEFEWYMKNDPRTTQILNSLKS